MPYRRTTFSKFIIDDQRRRGGGDTNLTALLNDVQTACKYIGTAVARGSLHPVANPLCGEPDAPPSGSPTPPSTNVHGEVQKPLDLIANEIMLRTCEYGGQLCGMASEEMDEPYAIPAEYPRGRYLLLFDPLDGSSNLEVNLTVGTIFSILRAPEGVEEPTVADFLQPGTQQVAAGFSLYGPADMLVASFGAGVHGFTMDREIGAYTLTHPDMRIPEAACEFAINASNERFWEPPVRRYVEECTRGRTGPRGQDFNMRWNACFVTEAYRILTRGGVFLYPRDVRPSHKPGRLRLLYEANPIGMLVEQAGGVASTGRERILDVQPTDLHQKVPVILGSKAEVERIVAYHAAHDRGEDAAFHAPLFGTRSIFLDTGTTPHA